MPRIPTYQQQVGAPDIRMDIEQFGAPGRAMQRAGMAIAETGFDVANRFKEAERAQKLMAGQAQMTRDLADLEMEFQNDTDWQTMRTRYQERTRGLLDRYRETFGGDQAVFGALSRDFQRSTIRGEIEVSKIARTRQVEAGKADLETALETYERILAETDDPLKAAEAQGRAISAISGAAAAGLIGADDAQKRERKFFDRIRETKAVGLVGRDPETALARLQDPNDRDFGTMDPLARERQVRSAQTAVDRLQRERIAAGERADRRAEHELRRTQARTEASLFDRVARGEYPNEAELGDLVRTQRLDPGAARAIRADRLRAQEQTDNPRVVIDVTDRMISGGEDVRPDILRAWEDGRLSRGTATQLLRENDQRQRTADMREFSSAEQREQFQRAMTVLGKDKLAFSFDDDTARRVAAAQTEIRERFRKGEPAAAVVDDVIAKYGTQSAVRRPIPYAAGLPLNNLADARAVKTHLDGLLSSGRITPSAHQDALRALADTAEGLSEPPPPRNNTQRGGAQVQGRN